MLNSNSLQFFKAKKCPTYLLFYEFLFIFISLNHRYLNCFSNIRK